MKRVASSLLRDVDKGWNDLRWRLAPTPIRMLLLSDGLAYTSEEQFTPFHRFRAELRRRFGLSVRFGRTDEAPTLSDYDIVGYKFTFRTDAREVVDKVRRARAATAGKIVYFDGDDDLNVQWPELLELCDLYVKKHAYRDRSEYAVPRKGKSNLTDWVASTYGYSFEDNPIPRSTPTHLGDKVWVGWDISLDSKIFRLGKSLADQAIGARPVQVCSRVAVSPEQWIYPLRQPVVDELARMHCTAVVPQGRVSQQDYYRELLNSEICVSPFGYGEICWRDFEAMLCGSMVVKPDMSHIETAGDVFRPGVTYAPVKWDFSDLAQVCNYYVSRPQERIAIAERARRVVRERHNSEWFLERVRVLLHKLNVEAASSRKVPLD